MALRDRIGEMFIEHGTPPEEVASVSSPTGALVADIVEVVATWLECDDLRDTIYDAMSTGPAVENVGKALAERARRPGR